MRRILLVAVTPLAILATSAAAQDLDVPDQAAGLSELSQSLSDPEKQHQIANTLAVLSEVLLDLPLAPIVEPLSRAAGDVTGEPTASVDPDLTLRRMRPEASDLPAKITSEVPRAMDMLAGMSDSLAALLPTLRTMSEQLKTAIPDDRPEQY